MLLQIVNVACFPILSLVNDLKIVKEWFYLPQQINNKKVNTNIGKLRLTIFLQIAIPVKL